MCMDDACVVSTCCEHLRLWDRYTGEVAQGSTAYSVCMSGVWCCLGFLEDHLERFGRGCLREGSHGGDFL